MPDALMFATRHLARYRARGLFNHRNRPNSDAPSSIVVRVCLVLSTVIVEGWESTTPFPLPRNFRPSHPRNRVTFPSIEPALPNLPPPQLFLSARESDEVLDLPPSIQFANSTKMPLDYSLLPGARSVKRGNQRRDFESEKQRVTGV